MLVESQDRFEDVGDFDPRSGRLVELKRNEPAARRLLTESLRGHYARLSDKLAVLYRDDGDLWLRLGEHAVPLRAQPPSVRYERTDRQHARLALLADGAEVAAVEYRPGPTIGPPLDEDPTPFIDAEDWDFGLFVHNVMTDDGRRQRIYSAESGA
jgi:hypothetical protein